jgi:hypothetical protein
VLVGEKVVGHKQWTTGKLLWPKLYIRIITIPLLIFAKLSTLKKLLFTNILG